MILNWFIFLICFTYLVISPENPCRRILGGIENQNDDDKNKSNDFSHVSIRKARFLSIFQQYEDEIARLSKYIELLNNEISNYKVLTIK